MTANRWDGFSDDELRGLDGAIGVEDQEYGAQDANLWQEIRDEILRRQYPDPADRLKIREWEAAISEDHRRFPTPLEAMLMAAYEPAIRSYLSSGRIAWLES